MCGVFFHRFLSETDFCASLVLSLVFRLYLTHFLCYLCSYFAEPRGNLEVYVLLRRDRKDLCAFCPYVVVLGTWVAVLALLASVGADVNFLRYFSHYR